MRPRCSGDSRNHLAQWSAAMCWLVCLAGTIGSWPSSAAAGDLRLAVFQADVSPPVGSPLAYDPTIAVQMPLSCRGVVLLGADQPIVLCSIDWIGVANEGHRIFRTELAQAAGTTVDRVALHAVHQHDAPTCDFSVEQLLAQAGATAVSYDGVFDRQAIQQVAAAVRESLAKAVEVTHVGVGRGLVSEVASNRRVLGPDGKVLHVRWSATADAAVRAYPVGIIDPWVRAISFWNQDQPVAVLTYYATHPQSYYRTGKANPDFPGMARNQRQSATGVFHVHFNGAGGNITAGKYNDGSTANRQVLADKLAAGMQQAWDSTERRALSAEQVNWQVTRTTLPAAPHLDASPLEARVADKQLPMVQREAAASDLVWLRRCQAGDPHEVSCLKLGDVAILNMPGELFVEYQLAAQRMRPDRFVAMASYGDYGPGYIGTEVAYTQGGYETTPPASRVGPGSERQLITAIAELLGERPR